MTATHDENCAKYAPRIARELGFDHVLIKPRGTWTNGEQPDAMAWATRSVGDIRAGESLVIEWKESIEDYRADADKPWRKYGAVALGNHRLFIMPLAIAKQALGDDNQCAWGIAGVRQSGNEWMYHTLREMHRYPAYSVDDRLAQVLLALNQPYREGERKPDSRGGKLSALMCGNVRDVLAKRGPMYAREIARELGSDSKFARRISEAAEAGQIPGVRYNGAGSELTLEE